jgi:hypothetical protein
VTERRGKGEHDDGRGPLISLVAFVYSRETKGVEMAEIDPVGRRFVRTASPAQPQELALRR